MGDGEETMIGYGSLGDAKQYVSAYVSGTAPDVRRYPISITVTTGIQVDTRPRQCRRRRWTITWTPRSMRAALSAP